MGQTDRDVFIEIGGEKLKLAYDMRAIKRVKQLCGINLLSNYNLQDPEAVIGVLWAGCLRNKPEWDGDIDQNGKPSESIQKALSFLEENIEYPDGLLEVYPILFQALAVEKGDGKEKKEKGKSQAAKD
jgi:hypothetical protein